MVRGDGAQVIRDSPEPASQVVIAEYGGRSFHTLADMIAYLGTIEGALRYEIQQELRDAILKHHEEVEHIMEEYFEYIKQDRMWTKATTKDQFLINWEPAKVVMMSAQQSRNKRIEAITTIKSQWGKDFITLLYPHFAKIGYTTLSAIQMLSNTGQTRLQCVACVN